MATYARTLDELDLIGGHVALDLTNTVDGPGGPFRADPRYTDFLATYHDAVDWAAHAGVLDPADVRTLQATARAHPARSAASLRRVHALRDTVWQGFHAVAGEGRFPLERWSELSPLVAAAVEHAVPVPVDGAVHTWTWPPDDLDAPWWAVAHAASELLSDPRLVRLKQCDACPWLFLDVSKNRSRRWCRMEGCGTDAKMRRYVEKRAARRRG